MDDLQELAIKVGRLEGRFDGLDDTLDSMGDKLDRLVAAEERRSGAAEQRKSTDEAATKRRDRHVAIVSGVASGAGVTGVNFIGRKLGFWMMAALLALPTWGRS